VIVPVEIGQVGIGAWGKNILRNLSMIGRCHIQLACDNDDAVLASMAELYRGINFTARYEDILADRAIKAVVIATPPALHYEMAVKAIEAGKDVFVEKPLALSVIEARGLVQLAKDNDSILMVGHIMEYHPVSLLLKQYIEDGDLGEIYYMYSSRINLGRVRKVENSLWSFAPHDISLMLMLMGKLPRTVTAAGADYLQQGVEDVSFLTMRFDDKTMAHVHVSWLDPHKERKLTIVGSKKMVVFDDTRASEKVWLYDKGVDTGLNYDTYAEYLSLRTGDIVLPQVPAGEPLHLEINHFLDCIINRTGPRSDGMDGLRILSVLQAAQTSMKQGGVPVEVEEITL
jgi:predicted dehydrogenase